MDSPAPQPDIEPDDPGGLRAVADDGNAPPKRRRRRTKKKKVASGRKKVKSDTKEKKATIKQEMLINVAQPEECRIGILEDGVLEELYVERSSQDNYVGNIYKGKIVNLEPSIQAAFVDFGVGRNGFLHISDVEPQYFRQGGFDPDKPIQNDGTQIPDKVSNDLDIDSDDDDVDESGPRPSRNNNRRRAGVRPRVKPPIQDIFQRGDEVVVQVIKEGIGTKGPTLSTYISIPGRYVVLMPALGRIGVSRKIESDDDRRRLRDILRELNPPKGLGFIVRTAGTDRTKKEISRDLAYLLRLWKTIVRRIKSAEAPTDIYEESDMIIRTIRDIFTADVDAIHIDEPAAYERAKEFLQIVMPRYVSRLQLYEGRDPLFHKYKIDEEIAQINQRKVPLKGGGSLVIDQTEALVAIDVNSGSFRTDGSAEESAFQLNQIAAREIARQLRLRDLGGVVVNDFIDMRKDRHRRIVERTLRDAVKRDRARTKILRISPFGLIEMTRQRIRPSLKRSVFKECPSCSGAGLVKSAESMAIEVVRKLMMASQGERVSKVTVSVEEEVAAYLNNRKRRELAQLEDDYKMVVYVNGSEGISPEHLEIVCEDEAGRVVLVDGV
ncbi:Rne/Rng family ribonuclease [Aeoliella sp. ICT_H6.2]|uniref:Ribonuclease G n=1 Tax=Aeoliella straminimaris TaxID=2954799 RepID=A0A9X2FHC4_9BACT|nr:Rne/Rng family ribonuclease [Aeoliella straminimaris]MCO6045876.1 Rne/Rng family ribonuclease [Aeoliella straminimaris]